MDDTLREAARPNQNLDPASARPTTTWWAAQTTEPRPGRPRGSSKTQKVGHNPTDHSAFPTNNYKKSREEAYRRVETGRHVANAGRAWLSALRDFKPWEAGPLQGSPPRHLFEMLWKNHLDKRRVSWVQRH